MRGSLIEEARRLVDAAAREQAPARLLGGMGIRLLLGERMDERFHRPIADLDFITTKRGGRLLEQAFAAQGWEPERHFNALNSARRLLFADPASGHKIDVFVERFEMCHSLPLAERLTTLPYTLPAAELAMTKLQIVSLNAKDRGDLYALLLGLEVSDHDDDAINAQRIAELTSADWGLHHTVDINLGRLRDGLGDGGVAGEQRALAERRITQLADAIEQAPKSRAWRLRAHVGERKLWYDEPEEVDR